MPKIKLEKSSNLSAMDAFSRIKKVLENDSDLRKLDPKFSCDFNDQTKSGSANGQFFKAEVSVEGSDSNSRVQIIVDLPLMMTPFKGMVEKTLQKKIDSTLA